MVEFDPAGNAHSLEEKPKAPRVPLCGDWAVFLRPAGSGSGLSDEARQRGELEITDVNRWYLERGRLSAEIFGRGMAWLDTGTHDSLLEASSFIQTIEKRQGLKVPVPGNSVPSRLRSMPPSLKRLPGRMASNGYGQYLRGLLERPAF